MSIETLDIKKKGSTSILEIDVPSIHKYVKHLLLDQGYGEAFSHYWNYTKQNIKVLDEFSSHVNASEEDLMVARIAIYFIYSGLSEDETDILIRSRDIARNYLERQGLGSADINRVNKAISVYDIDNPVTNDSEAIVQDVIHRYLGKRKFIRILQDKWVEWNLLFKEEINQLAYLEHQYQWMNTHEFHTSYAIEKYDPRKLKNIKLLHREIQELKASNTLNTNKRAMTMFRTALRNHIDLVHVADKKAGIMISINAILMTLMIPILSGKLLDVQQFILPYTVLIITCGVSVILATYATRPQIQDGKVSKDDVHDGDRSLFFFGNFFRMPKDEYREAIKSVIMKNQTFENSVINDLYDLGKILGVKYQRLRWCYMAFAAGIALTLITFGISLIFF